MFARVEKDAHDVEALRSVAPDIEKLVGSYGERAFLRGRLVATWRRIDENLSFERTRVQTSIANLDAQRSATESAIKRVEDQQAEANKEALVIGEQSGGLKRDQAVLNQLREAAQAFMPELEAGARTKLSSTVEDLVTRIAGAARANRGHVERELRELHGRIDRNSKLVGRYAEAVVTWLREHSGLDDDALADVFTVANPALLGELVGNEGRVSVQDPDAVVSMVRGIASAFDDASFVARGFSVRRGSKSGNSLEEYQDVDVVRERLEQDQARQAELEQVLADISVREKLEAAQKDAKAQLEAAKGRLRTWETWQQRQHELETVQASLDALAERARELEARQRNLQTRHSGLTLERSGFDEKIQTLRTGLQRQANDVQRLTQPPVRWQEGDLPSSADEANLDDLIRSFRQDDGAHRKLDSEVNKLFGTVEHQTAGRHLGADESETIDRLQDELAALEDRQRAVQELWTSLVDDMRSAFKGLVDAVDEVRREVSRLTSALGRRQVSNLERVELLLVRHQDLLGRLHAVIEAEAAPLFAGPQGRTRAAREVQAWLEQRARIELSDLFDLRFRIVDVRGQEKTFDSLSQIESQGTSTTIKVLVHLELLRMMLTDDTVVVPFFLDEVATLDQANLRALIDHASAMGFVPVVASPHASDCVDTLYFLRRGEGGLVLDATSRLVLRREASDGD